MAFGVPERPTPTPPPTERPIPTGTAQLARGAPWYAASAGADQAPQAAAAPQDDGFDGVLAQVHRLWSAALDDGGATLDAPGVSSVQPGAGAGYSPGNSAPVQPSAPTPFGDDLRRSTTVPAWTPIATEVGSRYGVPTDVALALIDTTSGGKPDAQLAGGKAVGLAGVPLAQFGPGQDPTDPATNLDVALGKLARLHAETGDWTRAATRWFGASDAAGNPRVLAPEADGFRFRQDFERARRRYGGA